MPDPISTTATPPDRDLVQRMIRGDDTAVSHLYDRYGSVLYALAFRILRQRADAEEVVMEALAQAWREAQRFETERGSVGAWLTTIARSRALDLARAHQRRDRITATAAQDRPERSPASGSWASDPGEAVEHGERRRRVEAALGELPPVQRAAIELAYFEGLSQSEIAERLNEPLGTVKTRVRLGMQKLRDALSPYVYERGA